MKTSKFTILIVLALLLNSCIIKSLQPFYTEKSISFTEKIIGNWQEDENTTWEIKSFKTEIEKDLKLDLDTEEGEKKFKENFFVKLKEKITNQNNNHKELLENYKKSYIIKYVKKNKEAVFIAVPFKINNTYFLDFIPLMYDNKDTNTLVKNHLIATHSVAKLDINASNKTLNLSWLYEDKIKDLLKANKLHLKHEEIGLEEDLILTAKSEELYAFLKKYMSSNIEDKWEASDKKTLTKIDAKP